MSEPNWKLMKKEIDTMQLVISTYCENREGECEGCPAIEPCNLLMG